MTTYGDLSSAIQDVADASKEDIKLALGDPTGLKIEYPPDIGTPPTPPEPGDTVTPGQEWLADKFTRIIIEGLANWLDDNEVPTIPALKTKINEIIENYNQLLDDYNNGVVPSTASTITPL